MTSNVSLEAFTRLGKVAAPSLGFFGATQSDCLIVPVGAEVRTIVLRVEFAKRDVLNLRGIRLYAKGKELRIAPADYTIEYSSIVGDPATNGPERLLSSKGYSSRFEDAPYWRLILREPAQIDEIRLLNRSDGWGCRSAALIVEIDDVSGQTVQLYRGLSSREIQRLLESLERVIGPLPVLHREASGSDALAWRSATLRRLRDLVMGTERPLAGLPWRYIMQVVGTWGETEPTDDEWEIIAAFLLTQYSAHRSTSVKAFSRSIDRRSRVVHLQKVLDEVADRRGLARCLLTSHGLARAGRLITDSTLYLAQLRLAMDFLESEGREPVLAYGTLLGAIRSQSFIPHDDDVDVLYFSRGRNHAAVVDDVKALSQSFTNAGFTMRGNSLPQHLNLHAFHPQTTVHVDIFPCWQEGGKLHMHMEKMVIRGIDPATMYPRGQAELHGERFPAPGRPEDFLRERYGSNWRTPDQFFGWGWTLRDD